MVEDTAPERLRRVQQAADSLKELKVQRPSVELASNHSQKGGETVSQILQATREVFIRNGHAALTMRAVAEQAGVFLGNITYYFPSKRSLIEAMLKEELADYFERQIARLEDQPNTPLDALLSSIDLFLETARSSHRFFLQLWGFAAADDEASKLVRELYFASGKMLYPLIKAANPNHSDRRIREIIIQISSFEEGLKLAKAIGLESDRTLRLAEERVRRFVREIVMEQ